MGKTIRCADAEPCRASAVVSGCRSVSLPLRVRLFSGTTWRPVGSVMLPRSARRLRVAAGPVFRALLGVLGVGPWVLPGWRSDLGVLSSFVGPFGACWTAVPLSPGLFPRVGDFSSDRCGVPGPAREGRRAGDDDFRCHSPACPWLPLPRLGWVEWRFLPELSGPGPAPRAVSALAMGLEWGFGGRLR